MPNNLQMPQRIGPVYQDVYVSHYLYNLGMPCAVICGHRPCDGPIPRPWSTTKILKWTDSLGS